MNKRFRHLHRTVAPTQTAGRRTAGRRTAAPTRTADEDGGARVPANEDAGARIPVNEDGGSHPEQLPSMEEHDGGDDGAAS